MRTEEDIGRISRDQSMSRNTLGMTCFRVKLVNA